MRAGLLGFFSTVAMGAFRILRLRAMADRWTMFVERRYPEMGPLFVSQLGTFYEGLGDGARAMVEYRRASELAPRDGYFHILLGHCLEAQGQISEAISSYETGLRLGAGISDQYHAAIASRLAQLKSRSEGSSNQH